MKTDVRIKISKREYDKLIDRITFFETTRNNLLSFSFTAVLTILGIAITHSFNIISCWLCLTPFFLIIPFSARIAYYRLATSHISSFLCVYAHNHMQFEIGAKTVKEGKCKHYRMIAWLVNHEMVMLGFATSAVFYFKYVKLLNFENPLHVISLLIPLILVKLVHSISNDLYDVTQISDNFTFSWQNYKKDKHNHSNG